jgi:hypothetical protein
MCCSNSRNHLGVTSGDLPDIRSRRFYKSRLSGFTYRSLSANVFQKSFVCTRC